MKKETKIEKKLSLKKLQLTKLNVIRGGYGNDNGTNGELQVIIVLLNQQKEQLVLMVE